MISNKKVIFVGGTSYSGSTMLDMMLSNNPDGFSVGEVHRLFYPTRPHHFNPQCGCSETGCRFWKDVHRAGEKNLYQQIFSIHEKISFIVDSSKNPLWIKKQEKRLKAQGIEVFHVLIWKEPAAFAHSMFKRNRKGWQKAWINYHRLYLTLIHNYVSIPYADLVRKPDAELFQLCKKTDIRYHKEQQNFWKKNHHTLFGNDSAKIHLSRETSTVNTGKETSGDMKIKTPPHRSIYHDKSYLGTLSKRDRHVIATSPHIQKISTILKNNDARKQTVNYSPFQIALKKIISPVKDRIKKETALHSRVQDKE